MLLVVELCGACAVRVVVNARPLGGIRWIRSTGLSSAIASVGLYMVAIAIVGLRYSMQKKVSVSAE